MRKRDLLDEPSNTTFEQIGLRPKSAVDGRGNSAFVRQLARAKVRSLPRIWSEAVRARFGNVGGVHRVLRHGTGVCLSLLHHCAATVCDGDTPLVSDVVGASTCLICRESGFLFSQVARLAIAILEFHKNFQKDLEHWNWTRSTSWAGCLGGGPNPNEDVKGRKFDVAGPRNFHL